MTVPTLPLTHWKAPKALFVIMNNTGEWMVYLLLAILAFIALSYYFCALVVWCIRKPKFCQQLDREYRKWYIRNCCEQCKFCGCCTCKCFIDCCKDLLLLLARKLNVSTFPTLFKELKVRRVNSLGTRRFMLFLDRKVEDSFHIIFAFYLLALTILSAALLVFFRYIPVAISGECYETDAKGRILFCYTNGSTAASLPVDCATYTSTELEELQFECYAISILQFGLAAAASLGLAKVAVRCISIYIVLIKVIYEQSKESTPLGKCAKYAYYPCLGLTVGLLVIIAIVSCLVVAVIRQSRLATAEGKLSFRVYVAYGILPPVLIPALIIVVCNLGKHCDREEYITLSKDQEPSRVDCRDEEPSAKSSVLRVSVDMSAGTVDISNTEDAWGGSHSDSDVATNDTTEVPLLQTCDNTPCAYDAIQT